MYDGFSNWCIDEERKPLKQKEPRRNRQITAPEIRVIDADGTQLGVMSPAEALAIAANRQMDLVEISPSAKPPVCKIIDYGKFKYEEKRKLKSAKKKQVVVDLKEIKFRPKTEEHDYSFKLRHVKRFLIEGDKVKVTMMFRGREVMYTALAKAMLQRIVEEIKDIAVIEQPLKMEGRQMTMVLAPLPGVKKKVVVVRPSRVSVDVQES